MFLDGYTALRLADLKSVRVVGGPESFAVMGLEHFREAPIAPKGIGLDTLKDLLATASRRYRLMAIHTEAVYTDVCYIGEVADLSERRLLMSEITPRATWEPKVSRYQFGDITRVEFGGRYVRALAAVSDRLDSRPDKPNKKGR
jgi:hypothetical protein